MKLRLLGRGRVQKQAVDEIEALPVDNPFRANALLLLSSLRSNLEVTQDLEPEDRELMMRLSPLLSEQLQMTLQSGIEQGLQQGIEQGIQQGIQQGIRRERRNSIESLLTVRFGTLDEPLTAIIEPLADLPPAEFLPLLLQLSRDELIGRFSRQN